MRRGRDQEVNEGFGEGRGAEGRHPERMRLWHETLRDRDGEADLLLAFSDERRRFQRVRDPVCRNLQTVDGQEDVRR